LLAASIDPSRRGETLSVADFVRLLQRSGDWEATPKEPQPEPQPQQQPQAQEHQIRAI
jgi:16S rRNA (adenine1518-N6/adenine1519-N6)-dimethyltransferase